jgi:hypothetical protein
MSVADGSIRRMDPLALLVGLLVGLLLGALAGAVAVAVLRRAPTGPDPALTASQLESAVLRVRGEEADRRSGLEAEVARLGALAEAREREVDAARRGSSSSSAGSSGRPRSDGCRTRPSTGCWRRSPP